MQSAKAEKGKGAAAIRKRKEREKTEARKSELQALVQWHMDRLPAEANKMAATAPQRESWRKSIDPLKLLEDCVQVIKMSPRLCGSRLPPPQDLGASSRERLGGGERAEEMPTSPQMYRRGLNISKTFGVLVVETARLGIIEGNMALENWWLLPEIMEQQRNLAGQSLWALVDWSDHDEIQKMQELFARNDHSIVGRKFRLGLIRMTKNEMVGSLAKIVLRTVEVIHLSANGSTALLGLHLEEADGRALVLDDDWLELKNKTSAFKIDFLKPSAPSQVPDDPMANIVRKDTQEKKFPGMSILKFEQMVETMTKYAPSVYVINGPDDDGVLRHMAFTKLSLSATLCSSTVPFIPLVNVRLGQARKSKDMTVDAGIAKEVGWESWMLRGEREPLHIVEATEETKLQNAFRFLQAVFSRTWSSPDQPPTDVLVGYALALPNAISVVRMCASGRRPALSKSPQVLVSSRWDDMEHDIKAIKGVFSFWEGQPQFMDLAT